MSGVTNVGVQTEMKSCVKFSSSRIFGSGNTHQLDGAADKPDILDVLGHVGTRA